MYYSIPGVLKASHNLEDVDYSDMTNLSHADSSNRSGQSRSQEEAEDDASKVSRRTRVSFECHPSPSLLKDILGDLEHELGDDQLLDLDAVVSMLGTGFFSTSHTQ